MYLFSLPFLMQQKNNDLTGEKTGLTHNIFGYCPLCDVCLALSWRFYVGVEHSDVPILPTIKTELHIP